MLLYTFHKKGGAFNHAFDVRIYYLSCKFRCIKASYLKPTC